MTEEQKAALEVWKVTIDVQKHFNDLSMRVRNHAITVLAALLAAAGYALKGRSTITIGGQTFSLTAGILTGALACWFAFYVMDLHWYHRLLRGAVKHGKQLEGNLQGQLPDIGLTMAIERASHIYGLRASQRLTIFYVVVGGVLAGAALAAFNAVVWQWGVLAVVLAIIAFTILVRLPGKAKDQPAEEAKAPLPNAP